MIGTSFSASSWREERHREHRFGSKSFHFADEPHAPLKKERSKGSEMFPPLPPAVVHRGSNYKDRREGETVAQYRRRLEREMSSLAREQRDIEKRVAGRRSLAEIEQAQLIHRRTRIQHISQIQKETPDEAEKAQVREDLLWKESREDGLRAIKSVHGGEMFLKKYANEAAQERRSIRRSRRTASTPQQ